MDVRLVVVSVCVLCQVYEGRGYSTGAGNGACVSLTPGHTSTSAQTSPPPFRVTATKIGTGAAYTVTVKLESLCDETFGGFLLQARRAENGSNQNIPIGTFDIIAQSKSHSCGWTGVQAVTHDSAVDKTKMEFIWTPPNPAEHVVFVPDDSVGIKKNDSREPKSFWRFIISSFWYLLFYSLFTAEDDRSSAARSSHQAINSPTGTTSMGRQVVICGKSITAGSSFIIQGLTSGIENSYVDDRATFAKNRPTYWTHVYSAVVKADESAVVEVGDMVYPTPSIPPCSPQQTTAAPTAPSGSAIVPYDQECGKTKGCFANCNGDTCDGLITWKTSGESKIEFELAAVVNADTDKWIALGFSTDGKMGSDSVIECAITNNDVKVYSSYNRDNSKSNARLSPSNTGVTKLAGSIVDGVLRCSIERNITVAGNDEFFDLNNKYFLFFAQGNTQSSSDEKKIHDLVKLPLVTDGEANLLSFERHGAVPFSDTMVKAHGSLMVAAWVFAASFGIVIARYFKQLGGSKHKACGEKIWFQIHRLSMILTFVCAAVAFIIIFIDVDGYSMVGQNEGEESYLRAHPILGIISTGLVVLNPLMAICRPHPNTPNRPIFNWAHWGVGTAAWIISIITIFFGFEIGKSNVHSVTKYVMAAFVAYQLVMEILLEILTYCAKTSYRSGDYEMKKLGGQEGDSSGQVYTHSEPGAGNMKIILLVIHFVVLVAFAIALIILVNNKV